MADINYHRDLVSILGTLNDVDVDPGYIEIDYSDDLLSKCHSLNIETEIIQTRLRLLSYSIQTKVFDSVETFLLTKEITNHSNFLIYNNSGIISYIDETTYYDFEPRQDYFLINNTRGFLEFQSFLKEQEKEVDGTFHFVDSYNMDIRKIIFISLAEKGRLNITYQLGSPHFNATQDLCGGLERYKACFSEENPSLTKFLKSTTIDVVSNFPIEFRFKQYFENLNLIVDKARINFEVYLNELSIDKIKKDYDDVKSKYFNGLSDILSKLSQNIIALPIGIAAVLFAVERIKNEASFLYLLIFAILVTSIYLSLLLKIHFKDIVYIQRIFNYDFELLIGNNFFKKYPEESILFFEIKDIINNRVKFIKLIIESYFWVMNFANLFIIGLSLSYLKIRNTGIVIFVITVLIMLSIVRNYIFDKLDSENRSGL